MEVVTPIDRLIWLFDWFNVRYLPNFKEILGTWKIFIGIIRFKIISFYQMMKWNIYDTLGTRLLDRYGAEDMKIYW